MQYTVFTYDDGNYQLLGEYDKATLDRLTGEGFYCDYWTRYLKFKRSDLLIVAGEIVEAI